MNDGASQRILPEPYDATTRLIHAWLAVFGVAAIVSGQFADDYRHGAAPGFYVHAALAVPFVALLAARALWGVLGPAHARFSRWRLAHHGLAGVVQAAGIAVFGWMALTGAILYVGLEPGLRATGWVDAVKELHEGAAWAAIGYVVLHAGAALAHELLGEPILRRMFR